MDSLSIYVCNMQFVSTTNKWDSDQLTTQQIFGESSHLISIQNFQILPRNSDQYTKKTALVTNSMEIIGSKPLKQH